MSIRLIDVQCGFGGAAPGVRHVVSAAETVAAQRELAIARSLVRLTPEKMDTDVPFSNARLAAACQAEPTLTPCPVVMPACGGDLPAEADQVAACLAMGAAAVVVRPAQDGWLPVPWMADPLFRALEERRLPVLLLERFVTLEQAAALAERFPALPFILAQQGYRSQRMLMALLGAFPNLHLSIGNNYGVHGGLEQICRVHGARRLLFGTEFPNAEPMAAVTYLMYSALSDEEKEQVGCRTFETLEGGIAR